MMKSRSRSVDRTEEAVNSVPAISLGGAIAKLGPKASERVFTFFTDSIRNANTRVAYLNAIRRYSTWLESRGLDLNTARSFHVSAFLEDLGKTHSIPTVKLNLAAVRMLFDWLVIGQIIPTNPAHAVRGPRYSVQSGKTIALDEAEAKILLASIPTDSLIGLRDRAMIGLMIYSFARVSAALGMNVSDYFPKGKRYWIRLHEKGGKHHEMPAHHKLEEYLDEYIEAAKLSGEPKSPLFRSADGRSDRLTLNRLHRSNAYHAIRKRSENAGIRTQISAHSFRATGITNYLKNGGSLGEAQRMAAHADPRTTRLYDRRSDAISLDEIERITI